MHRTGGKILFFCIKGCKAKNVCIEDRTCAETRSQSIANHSADPRSGSPIRLQSTRVIVGFHLKGDSPLIIDSNDSRIVFEHRPTPRFIQFSGNRENRLLEHVAVDEITMTDSSAQGLVAAVLRPCLGNRLQLDFTRISFELTVVMLDRLKGPRPISASRLTP